MGKVSKFGHKLLCGVLCWHFIGWQVWLNVAFVQPHLWLFLGSNHLPMMILYLYF